MRRTTLPSPHLGRSLLLLFAAFSLLAPALPAKAAEVSPGGRVEFTRTQDLSGEARATNRPVNDKWAVVIGINDFLEKPLNNNLGMDRAARRFYDYLIDPRYGRFDKDHVRLLTNEEATRQGILGATGPQWLGTVAGPDDLVVVFMGTHGFPAGDGNTYICTHNTQLDNLFATGISMQGFMQSLRKNVKSDRIVLVLQSCYSGAAELQSGAKALFKTFNIDLEKVVLGKGYVILSSSRPDQITWGDVFSTHLIDALREKEGMVPLQEAFRLAQQRTEYDTTHDAVGVKPQTPVMKSDWKGNDLVLGVPPLKRIAAVPAGAANYLAAEAHYMLASKAAAAGDLPAAIKEYRASIDTDPSYADAYSDYGSALALSGQWEDAAAKFRKAIEINPEDSLFHYNYARCLAKLGRGDESATELTRAYALNSKDRAVLMALADRAVRQSDLSSAVRFVDEALDLYPKSAALHDRKSYLLTRKGELDPALSEASEAIKLDPALASAHLNQGSIYMLQGKAEMAAAAYRQGLKLAPESADAHYLLGTALATTSDIAGARQELTRFVEMSADGDPRRQKARQLLSELAAP